MKHRNRFVISMALLLALVFALTACGGGASSQPPAQSSAEPAASSQAPAASASAPPASEPAAREKVVLELYKNNGSAEYPADGGEGKKLMLQMLEAYGLGHIDFNVTTIGGTEFFDKLNILAVSGSLPDYFSLNMVTMTNFADQGLIQPLEDHVQKLTHLYPLMRESELEAVTYNGHLYAFPVGYLPGAINGPNTNGYLIREDWLDNLNMTMPETVDELHEVMLAFTKNDPDGNGKNDTTGLLANKEHLFDDIFGAYGILPSAWQEADGKIMLGSVRPEIKEPLQILQDWYAEGIIDPDIFVSDDKLKDQKLANSYGGVYSGNAFGASPSNPEHAALLGATPTAKLTALHAVKGPNGDFGRIESAPGYGNIHGISSDCKDTESLLEFLNWCADSSEGGGMYVCSVGVPGLHHNLSDDEKVITMLTSYDQIYAYGLGNPIRFVQVVDRRWLEPEAVPAFELFADQYRENLCWQTVPSMLDYPDTSLNLFREYLAKIVMGSLPVSAHDEYVERFYQMGGDLIEKEVNELVASR